MKLAHTLTVFLAGAMLLCTCTEAQAGERKYVSFGAPCVVDQGFFTREDTEKLVARLIREGDSEALYGLVERGKVIVLAKGTKFDASFDHKNGFIWGFVESGRHVGRKCSIIKTFLQDQPPTK